jgi:hypothetical protein
MFAERVMEHLELSGFEIDESRAGHEEAPANPEPRLRRRFSRSAGTSSSALNLCLNAPQL